MEAIKKGGKAARPSEPGDHSPRRTSKMTTRDGFLDGRVVLSRNSRANQPAPLGQ